MLKLWVGGLGLLLSVSAFAYEAAHCPPEIICTQQSDYTMRCEIVNNSQYFPPFNHVSKQVPAGTYALNHVDNRLDAVTQHWYVICKYDLQNGSNYQKYQLTLQSNPSSYDLRHDGSMWGPAGREDLYICRNGGTPPVSPSACPLYVHPMWWPPK